MNNISVFAQNVHQKIEVRWEVIEPDKGKWNPVSKLVLFNRSAESIPCNGWSLWFNFMRSIDPASVSAGFKIEHKNGDLYQLSFVNQQQVIPANNSIEITFVTKGVLPNFTDVPAGLYIAYSNPELPSYDIGDAILVKKPYVKSEVLAELSEQYSLNTLKEKSAEQLVIPQPFSIKQNKGNFVLASGALLSADKIFEKEAAYLQRFLANTSGIVLSIAEEKGANAQIKISQSNQLKQDEYHLIINDKGIKIVSGTAHGAFYAIQSLKSLSEVQYWYKSAKKMAFPFVEIQDKPRFNYRGLMVDVARNFHTKESILRIIDAMAMYKLNTLHLHLNDDEGWRLEIPAIPELTEVGSIRNAAYSEGNSLQPSYGSGAIAKTKAFYTADDFIDILRYAADRYITVIPELETPGHARAAIKSMQARYKKYMALGNKKEAEKFLLNDFGDQSVYSSAQNWNDNVMNVAMPSVYTFISTVIDEIKVMYEKAGLPLNTIHLGGDEVPGGAWEKSPKIRNMMDSLKLATVYDVWPYYISKISDMCKSKELEIAGWEEMGMLNKGKGMQVNPQLSQKGIQLDVWNNLIGDGQEDLAYKLANAGYKVVFTSASNLYFDLAWTNNFSEPGHSWAGFTNLRKSYSFLPANYFLNVFTNSKGKQLKAGYFDQKERLTQQGKNNLIGIKGAIWTEKVRSPERLAYMLFPRLLALADRAWSPERVWEQGTAYNEKAFEQDYAAFVQKLGKQELQKLSRLNNGYNYRLPAIGVKLSEGLLYCNTEYPGFDIYYTADGTEPTLNSKKYSEPIKVNNASAYKFKVITQQERSGDTVTLNLDTL